MLKPDIQPKPTFQSLTRRTLLTAVASFPALKRLAAAPRIAVMGLDLIPVPASERTVWLMVRLTTDRGLIGLGEASDAFGYTNTTKQQAQRMESELRAFFELTRGKSPLDVEAFLRNNNPRAMLAPRL